MKTSFRLEASSVALRAALRHAMRGPLRSGWPLGASVAQAVMRHTLMASKKRGIPWLRQAQASVPLPSPALRRVRFEPTLAGGVPAQWCVPRDGEPRRVVLYLHGGGYAIGSVASHRDLLARVALAADARVLGLDYRLAPEHRFPAAHDDCLAAYRWLLDGRAQPERLAVAGDSAGGALAVATLLAARDASGPLASAGVLLCPWVDPLASGGSMEANEAYDFGDRELLVGWIDAYAGEDAADPRVSLLRADLRGLPPLLVQAGGGEILLDQIRAFDERARAAGVDVELRVHGELFHVFQAVAGVLPQAREAIEEIGSFLRERLKD